MSRHSPVFIAAHPRGEPELNHLGVSVSYPSDAAAQAEADRRNGATRGDGR